MQWLDFKGDEIEGLCFKTDQHKIQAGVKTFGGEWKTSAMKEIRNLAIKNNCFGELKCDSISEDVKRKALPLLMFMVLKRNGEIKSRGVSNGSLQRV